MIAILIPFCLLKKNSPFLASFLYYFFQPIPETFSRFNKLLHGSTYLKCFSFLIKQRDQIAFTASNIVCSGAPDRKTQRALWFLHIEGTGLGRLCHPHLVALSTAGHPFPRSFISPSAFCFSVLLPFFLHRPSMGTSPKVLCPLFFLFCLSVRSRLFS